MTHNEFDLHKDLYEPIMQFIVESQIITSIVDGNATKIKQKYFLPPKYIRELGSDNERKLYESTKLIQKQNQRSTESANIKKTKSSPQLIPLIQM